MAIKSETQKIEIGKRIKAVRLSLGLSMQEFAKLVDPNGKAQSGTVANWETGKNAPNKKRLARIANLGDVSVVFLLNGFTSNEYKEFKEFKEFKELSKKRKEYINMTGKIRFKLPKDSYVHTKEGNEGHFINCKENRDENYIEVTREGLDILLDDIFKSNWK